MSECNSAIKAFKCMCTDCKVEGPTPYEIFENLNREMCKACNSTRLTCSCDLSEFEMQLDALAADLKGVSFKLGYERGKLGRDQDLIERLRNSYVTIQSDMIKIGSYISDMHKYAFAIAELKLQDIKKLREQIAVLTAENEDHQRFKDHMLTYVYDKHSFAKPVSAAVSAPSSAPSSARAPKRARFDADAMALDLGVKLGSVFEATAATAAAAATAASDAT